METYTVKTTYPAGTPPALVLAVAVHDTGLTLDAALATAARVLRTHPWMLAATIERETGTGAGGATTAATVPTEVGRPNA